MRNARSAWTDEHESEHLQKMAAELDEDIEQLVDGEELGQLMQVWSKLRCEIQKLEQSKRRRRPWL